MTVTRRVNTSKSVWGSHPPHQSTTNGTLEDFEEYLSLPLSTVQLALRQVHRMAPRVQSKDIEVDHRGRREKRYRFQRLINSI